MLSGIVTRDYSYAGAIVGHRTWITSIWSIGKALWKGGTIWVAGKGNLKDCESRNPLSVVQVYASKVFKTRVV